MAAPEAQATAAVSRNRRIHSFANAGLDQTFRTGNPVARRDIQQGDLVFFATGRSRRVSHVGIYSGGSHFIHAPGRGKSIRTASLENSYFRSRYKGARRYH